MTAFLMMGSGSVLEYQQPTFKLESIYSIKDVMHKMLPCFFCALAFLLKKVSTHFKLIQDFPCVKIFPSTEISISPTTSVVH